jgi:methyl-accepting chemotaxis protein
MLSMFGKLDIAGRLYALSGALIALVIVMAISATTGGNLVRKDVAAYRDVAEARNLVANMNEDLLEVRLAALKYRSTPKGDYAENVRSNVGELRAARADIDAVVRKAAIRRELENAVRDAQAYGAAFEEATRVQGSARETIFANKLDVIGPRITARIDGVDDALSEEQGIIGAQTFADIANIANLQALIGVVAVVLGLAGAPLLTRGITRPIHAVADAMKHITAGELNTDVPGTERADTIGHFARMAVEVRDTARAREHEAEAKRAESQRAAERAEQMRRKTEIFEQHVGQFMERMTASMHELDETANQMASAAEQTTQQTNSTAAASQQGSSNVDTVASASEEVTNSIAEVNQNVAATKEKAGSAREGAEQVSEDVRALKTAVSEISEVTGLINDIADKTNLLALNATIEAARAGDAGKGFAVVAGEVKTLANQTRKATEDIETRIATVQARTDESVAGITSVRDNIREIDEMTASVASAMEEQSTALGEIAKNIQEAAQSTGEVAENVEGLRSAAETTSASAEQVSHTSRQVADQGHSLKTQIADYIRQVRGETAIA